jgi:hypothetical protein
MIKKNGKIKKGASMTDIGDTEEKRFRLKQKFLRSAIAQGRGAEAIAKLNTLYRNVRETLKGSDDDIVGNWSEKLTGRRYRVTLQELEDVASADESKFIRAFNMCQLLQGSARRLHQTMILPGTPTIN